jgi:hypothetical protein
MEFIMSVWTSPWCTNAFLAVQDREGVSFLMEDTTPFWDKIHYQELRYWASLLTGHMPCPDPDVSPYFQTLNSWLSCVFIVCYLFIFCFIAKQSYFLIGVFSVVYAAVWFYGPY